jgi:hypothetical protein
MDGQRYLRFQRVFVAHLMDALAAPATRQAAQALADAEESDPPRSMTHQVVSQPKLFNARGNAITQLVDGLMAGMQFATAYTNVLLLLASKEGQAHQPLLRDELLSVLASARAASDGGKAAAAALPLQDALSAWQAVCIKSDVWLHVPRLRILPVLAATERMLLDGLLFQTPAAAEACGKERVNGNGHANGNGMIDATPSASAHEVANGAAAGTRPGRGEQLQLAAGTTSVYLSRLIHFDDRIFPLGRSAPDREEAAAGTTAKDTAYPLAALDAGSPLLCPYAARLSLDNFASVQTPAAAEHHAFGAVHRGCPAKDFCSQASMQRREQRHSNCVDQAAAELDAASRCGMRRNAPSARDTSMFVTCGAWSFFAGSRRPASTSVPRK